MRLLTPVTACRPTTMIAIGMDARSCWTYQSPRRVADMALLGPDEGRAGG